MNTNDFKSLLKAMLALVILFTNAAFKKGDTLQLQRDLNGRSTRNFYKAAGNFKLRVKAGTIASVMDYRRLGSGNYGIQVRLDGPEFKDKPESERTVWIYDWANREDDVKACADSGCVEEAKSMEQAGWAQPQTDQVGTANPPEVIVDNKPTTTPRVIVERAAPKIEIIKDEDRDEATTAAGVSTCQGAACATGVAPSALKAVAQTFEEALPTSREEELEDPVITEEDLAPSDNKISIKGEGLTFDGGATLPKACHHIIDNQGKIGETGRLLLGAMLNTPRYNTVQTVFNPETKMSERVLQSVYLKDDVMGGLCPGFSKMNRAQKATTLVHMWAALALKETTCDVNNKHTALVPAQGMFTAVRASANRWQFSPACKGDISKPEVQVACAVGTEAEWRGGLKSGKNLTQSRYFEPLQRWNKYKTRSGKRYTPVLQYMKRIKQCEI